MRHFYTLFLYCLLPFAILRLLWKSRTNRNYRRRIAERFALQLPPPPTEKPLWIHTVSVGEFLAIKPLIEFIITRHINLPLWITSTTPTGSQQIQKFAAQHPFVSHSYFPYDTPNILSRFLTHVRPCGVILMETEIWPNLLLLTAAKNVPSVLINARLSAKSLRGYYLYAGKLLRKALPTLMINAQTKDDARRFRKLGVPTNNIRVTANLKYHRQTITPAADFSALKASIRQYTFIWLAASTHRGEDAIILQAHQQLRTHIPNSLLFIAPRHPERRQEIIELTQTMGFIPRLRSQADTPKSSDDVWIIDTLGELNTFFSLADAAFIGGSLIKHGGHNPLEALHAGIPVCYGPSMYNFSAIAAALNKQPFAQTVTQADTLTQTLCRYQQQDMSDLIRQFNHRHQQILALHYQFIATHISLDK